MRSSVCVNFCIVSLLLKSSFMLWRYWKLLMNGAHVWEWKIDFFISPSLLPPCSLLFISCLLAFVLHAVPSSSWWFFLQHSLDPSTMYTAFQSEEMSKIKCQWAVEIWGFICVCECVEIVAQFDPKMTLEWNLKVFGFQHRFGREDKGSWK